MMGQDHRTRRCQIGQEISHVSKCFHTRAHVRRQIARQVDLRPDVKELLRIVNVGAFVRLGNKTQQNPMNQTSNEG